MEGGKSIGTYLIAAAVLLLLLGLTLTMAFVDLGSLNLPVAMAIAACKALLVVVFFMHIRSGSQVTKLAAMAGLLWLAFMFVLTLTDFLTRS